MMNILWDAVRQILRWITAPPGDLFYFLTTLFTLQLMLFLTASPHRAAAGPTPHARRWTRAIQGLLAGRVALMIVALLGTLNLLSPAQIMPPLERWLEFMSVLVVMWAALFGHRAARWQTVGLALLFVVSLAFYGYNAATWPAWQMAHYAYNGLFLEQIWELSIIALLLLHLVLTLLLRPPEWEWLFGCLIFWFLGHAAQLQWPDAQLNFSGWLRLGALVTMPLLAALVHRQLLIAITPQTHAVAAQFDVDLLQEVLQSIESARELEPLLMILSSKLARLLEAEMCAVALKTAGDAPTVRVVALHPLNAAQIQTPELSIGAYDSLAQAFQERTPLIVQPPERPEWLPALYQHLEFDHVGPLIIYPLVHKRQSIGLLLLGNPESQRRWPAKVSETQQLIVQLVATAIARAQSQGSSFLERLRGQEEPEQQRLEASLSQAQNEVKTLNGRLTVLVKEIKSRDREILQLNREIESRAKQSDSAEMSFWQNEVKELAHERELLEERFEAVEAERKTYAHRVEELQRDLEMLQTDRYRLAEQLAEAKDALLEAQDAPPPAKSDLANANIMGLVVTDANGSIVLADALARQMLRLPEGNLIGVPIAGAFADPRWSQTTAALLQKQSAKPLQQAHLSLVAVDGSPVEADLVALRGPDGEPNGLTIALRAPDNQVERYEAIVGLANDFRTPMTAITGYTDLLQNEQAGILTEMQQQFLERVRANVEQMNQLLNDLLRTASPESRPVELSPQPVQIAEIVESAALGLQARLQERELTLDIQTPPGLPAVQVDRDSLYQILLRLLSNAALCSQKGSQIQLRAQQDDSAGNGSYLRISVTDTGGGIAPDDYPRVFRRFYRANQPLVQGLGETGMGMAVAKTLVEANGGRIWVASEAGQGSTFSFILPTDNPKTAA